MKNVPLQQNVLLHQVRQLGLRVLQTVGLPAYPLGMLLGGFCEDHLAVAIPTLRVVASKNAMDSMNRCVAFTDGAHSKKGYDSPERNPFRATR